MLLHRIRFASSSSLMSILLRVKSSTRPYWIELDMPFFYLLLRFGYRSYRAEVKGIQDRLERFQPVTFFRVRTAFERFKVVDPSATVAQQGRSKRVNARVLMQE